jgi:gliding motility-associated-like protein
MISRYAVKMWSNPTFEDHWEPDSLIGAGQNTTVILANITETTTFTVNSTSDDGCEATDEVTVSVSNLGANSAVATATDYVIGADQTTQLQGGPSGYTYSWTPASSLSNANSANPVASPGENTIYTLTITDGECTASDTVSIRVLNLICGPPNIYVPNAFTPNDDDKNEKLYVRGVNLTEVHLVIFDRWGEMVFESRSLQDGWDATFKGKPVDPDVFVYYLEAVCAGGEEYFEEGNVTVIR